MQDQITQNEINRIKQLPVSGVLLRLACSKDANWLNYFKLYFAIKEENTNINIKEDNADKLQNDNPQNDNTMLLS